MRVAGEREPADDSPVVVLGHEDGRVGVAPHGPQVAPLVARRCATRRSSEATRPPRCRPRPRARRAPARRPAPPGGSRSRDDDPVTATAWIARSGERAVGPTLDRRRRRRSRGSCPPTGSRRSPPACSCCAGLSGQPPSTCTTPSSTWSRGWPIASATGSAAGDDVVDRPAGWPPRAVPTRRCRRRAAAHRRRARSSAPSCSAGGRRPRAPPCRSRRARRACCSAGSPARRRRSPSPRVDESAAALPSSSITETCVVPVSGASRAGTAVAGEQRAGERRRRAARPTPVRQDRRSTARPADDDRHRPSRAAGR